MFASKTVLGSVCFSLLLSGVVMAAPQNVCQESYDGCVESVLVKVSSVMLQAKDDKDACTLQCEVFQGSFLSMCGFACHSAYKTTVTTIKKRGKGAKEKCAEALQACGKDGVCLPGNAWNPDLNACCLKAQYIEDCSCARGSVIVPSSDYDDNGCFLGTSCSCETVCKAPVCDTGDPIDTDGDNCPDTCICQIAIDCFPGYNAVDTNGDGCQDTCEAACTKDEYFDVNLGACCLSDVIPPPCPQCPVGWNGSLQHNYDDSGCLASYTCLCEEPQGECMSDNDCDAGQTCSAAEDCLTCASCPQCDVCCGICEDGPTTCGPDDCGPGLGMPNFLCADGITIAGPGACILLEEGMCGWEIVSCPDESCTVDSDCAEGTWCRPTCDQDNVNECVPYVTEGESCGGFTPFCFLSKCDPSLSCVAQDPTIPDLPGICMDPSPCEPGVQEVNCFADPCDFATCDAFPKADCVANYCGGCNAEFFVNGEMVDCTLPVDECVYDGVTYQAGDSFDGAGDDWCNSCSCMEGGLVACTKILCGPVGCSSDDDCAEGSWCRPTCDENFMQSTTNECVPYASEGMSCGGFTLPCFLSICDPSLSCVDQNPLIADEPGICMDPSPCDEGVQEVNCFANPCDVNSCDAYPKADCVANYCGGCNAEFYVNGKMVDCSVPSTCDSNGTIYAEGDSFPGTGDNWCNSCTCMEGGLIACTDMFCGPEPTSCESDQDCGAGEWCRVSCDGDGTTMECVPFVSEGEYCGGYTPVCMVSLCEPGLLCVAQDPMIPDLPGICTGPSSPCEDGVVEVQCLVDPCQFATCDAYPKAECVANYCGGCNADFFMDGELMDCTESTTCESDGIEYQVGESFAGTGSNWCNTCSCADGGGVSCTKMACSENPCMATGCSGQICAESNMVSTCDFLPEYACYSSVGNCGPFGPDGTCGWEGTTALNMCLDEAGSGGGESSPFDGAVK